MSELNNVATQLKSLAKSLLGEVADIDKKIELLHNKRHAITSGHVSKEDYLFYVRAHLKIRSDQFKGQLIRDIEKKTSRNFGTLERQYENKDTFVGMTFLTSYPSPFDISENAIYFYFGELIIERIKDALDVMDWPDGIMPIDARRKELITIEASVAELIKKRDEIVKSLDDVGISR